MHATSSTRARRPIIVAALTLLIVAAATATPADAVGPKHQRSTRITVVLDGLNSPKGLTAAFGVVPVVGQGAFGPPGPVLLSVGKGRSAELTEPIAAVDTALANDGSLWVLEADTGLLYRKTAFGGLEQVADIRAYQAVDVDEETTDENPEESNPYGLAALPNGDALVADAAGNDVLRVDRKGRIRTVARFAPQMVATDHIPGFPVPEMPTESVPTSIAVTRNAIYVGELKGFPFRPGSSNIYKLPLNAIDVRCEAAVPTTSCQVAQTGFTSIQDIAIDPITGTLYVYELAADGALAFEAGFETGEFPPAVLLEVRGTNRRELAAGQLSQPGGVTAAFGIVHVTDGIFGAGRLLRITG